MQLAAGSPGAARAAVFCHCGSKTVAHITLLLGRHAAPRPAGDRAMSGCWSGVRRFQCCRRWRIWACVPAASSRKRSLLLKKLFLLLRGHLLQPVDPVRRQVSMRRCAGRQRILAAGAARATRRRCLALAALLARDALDPAASVAPAQCRPAGRSQRPEQRVWHRSSLLPEFRLDPSVETALPARVMTGKFGERVEVRDHVVILKHRQIFDHPEVGLAAALRHDRLAIGRLRPHRRRCHTDKSTTAASAQGRAWRWQRWQQPRPEAAAADCCGNARAARSASKRRRGRHRRQFVEHARERAELLGALAAGGALGQMRPRPCAPLSQAGLAVQVGDSDFFSMPARAVHPTYPHSSRAVRLRSRRCVRLTSRQAAPAPLAAFRMRETSSDFSALSEHSRILAISS